MPEFQPMTREELRKVESWLDRSKPTTRYTVDNVNVRRIIATVRDREARLRRAVEAIEWLMDWQNGCPILTAKWEKGWGNAMKRCKASLAENADLLKGGSSSGS